jgi:hypothetical protein
MKEREKADELYNNALKLHGAEKAKEESLKSARATYSLAPFRDGLMKNRTYWERVIEHLQNK